MYSQLTGLPSEMRNNAVKVVTAAWKSWTATGQRGHPPTFTREAVYYTHGRDWSLLKPNLVSLRTLGRRVRIDYATSRIDADRIRKASLHDGLGGAHLLRTSRGWFLRASVELPDPPSWTPTTPIGVDRGVKWMIAARGPHSVPLLVDAAPLNHMKLRSAELASRLQRKGTRSAKRVLRKLSERDRGMLRDASRKISRRLVEYALSFENPILVFEDLKGVQGRCLRHKRRGAKPTFQVLLNGWAYRQLLSCVELAAEAQGVPIAFVNAAWSSRTCPKCGDAREANRRGSKFHCGYCGYQNLADVVGATNLARRWSSEHARGSWGPVNGPNECGHPMKRNLFSGRVGDAQAVDSVDGVDTPLPTSRRPVSGAGVEPATSGCLRSAVVDTTASPYESDAPPG